MACESNIFQLTSKMLLWYIATRAKEGQALRFVPLCSTWDFSTTLTTVWDSLVIRDLHVEKAYHSLASFVICTTLRHSTDTRWSHLLWSDSGVYSLWTYLLIVVMAVCHFSMCITAEDWISRKLSRILQQSSTQLKREESSFYWQSNNKMHASWLET